MPFRKHVFSLFGLSGPQDYLASTGWKDAPGYVENGLDQSLADILDDEFASVRATYPGKGVRFYRVTAAVSAAKHLVAIKRPDAARFVLGMIEGAENQGAAYLIQRLRVAAAMDSETEVAEAIRLARASDKASPAIQRLADQVHKRYRQEEVSAAAFHATWRNPQENLVEALRNLAPGGPSDTQLPPEPLIRWVYSLRREGGTSYEDFRERCLWGARASRFTGDAMSTLVNDLKGEGQGQAYQALRKQFDDLVDRIDAAPFKSVLDEGRSVLLASTHAGMFGLMSWRTQQIALPTLRVGANTKRESVGDQQLFLSTRGDFQKEFLKAIKLLKKSPRVISIAADGPYGSDMKTFDFHGLPIDVAQGPATMAYHTKASTFFTRTRWVNDHVCIDVIPGPQVEPGMTREAWGEVWYPFYLEQLTQIVTGPPEDMRLNTGFWSTLRKALKADAI
ncbi:MAG: hypothetical protein Q7J57_05200 [Gemmobacter sp.]|nr:hypothetical protein [Gemmobacter sp.]